MQLVLQIRIALPAVALLMLGGSLTALHAQDAAPSAAAAQVPLAAPADLPRFAPSAAPEELEAGFETEIAIAETAPEVAEHLGEGVASYYGASFAGRPTASGESFNPQEMTAAHRTLPFGSRVRVTNSGNGQSVVVRINDRGPFHGGRMIDLSRAAAEEIGIVRAGHGKVELELLAAS